jgi:hypothetical protein
MTTLPGYVLSATPDHQCSCGFASLDEYAVSVERSARTVIDCVC